MKDLKKGSNDRQRFNNPTGNDMVEVQKLWFRL